MATLPITKHSVYLEPIERLLENSAVSDIFINGMGRVFALQSGKIIEQESRFVSERQVRHFAQYWISYGRRRLDEGMPCADVDIEFPKYSIRFHAVLDVLSPQGTLVSIRIHRKESKQLLSYADRGCLSSSQLQLVLHALRSRSNILISGATGSGKTTFLNALIDELNPAERVIVIEDSNEIKSDHPHCVNLQTRQKNIEDKGEISAEELIFQSLRMRPDRLVVGEFRGRETHSLLSAFNTGHSGFATIHANSVQEVPQRLETLCLLAGIPLEVAQRYAKETFDLYVHLQYDNGQYKISHVLTNPHKGTV